MCLLQSGRLFKALTAHVQDASMAPRRRGDSTNDNDQRPCAPYAPMTKNNLAVHLKWLLKQGPSLYPSLTTESPPVERDIRVSQQPTPPSDKNETLGAILEDGDDATDESMARLMLAPSSASKPRMLSRPDPRSENTPPTAKKLSSSRSVVQGVWLIW